jgi:Zn-dependent M28 family amino/carboxypeptidase
MNRITSFLAFFFSLLTLACTSEKSEEVANSTIESITAEDLQNHVTTLASDEFQGRMPFTEGEEKTIAYLKNTFQEMGLEPGNGESYFQEVPMVEINAIPDKTVTIEGNGQSLDMEYVKDYVALTRRVTDKVEINDSELVFAGFGIVAPEYDWNDYAGIDWKGKTAVVLVNDPGFGSDDSTFFKGNTMTYYGRWTYKYEEAARQGADGVLIVHNTAPAGYPWGVVQNGWTGANLYLQSENNNMDRCAFEGWITQSVAQQIFELTGVENALGNARKPGFKPVPLEMKLSMTLENTYKSSASQNVIAKVTGSSRPDEYIIYTAHWDHLGIGAPIEGDSIYNGAVDNASGTACLLEIADAFSKLPQKPERTVIFLAVTAEEQGLLGSEYYVENPIYPLTKTVANINMDALQFRGKMKDLTIVGYGQSELDEYAKAAATQQDRYIYPDPNAEKGYFFRSDHFNFAKKGVPALYASGEYEQAEKGVEWTKQQTDEWISKNYHQPSDEFVEGEWNFEGMVQDTQLLFEVGYQLSQENTFPQWKEGSEFKSIREEAMSQQGVSMLK